MKYFGIMALLLYSSMNWAMEHTLSLSHNINDSVLYCTETLSFSDENSDVQMHDAKRKKMNPVTQIAKIYCSYCPDIRFLDLPHTKQDKKPDVVDNNKSIQPNIITTPNSRVACSRPGCSADFYDLYTMQRHVRSVHMNIRFQCTHCGKYFCRNDYKNGHQNKCPEGQVVITLGDGQ